MPKAPAYNYDDAPKGRETFPRMYANVEIDTAERKDGDRGTYFALEGHICKPHADGTLVHDGKPVYISFNVGHENDPDAEDPKTWTKENTVNGFIVASMIELLKASGLTKGEGRGVHPAELFPDLEGKKVTVFFATNKKGYQTQRFYTLGEREPMIVGSEGDAAVSRRPRVAAAEPDADVDTDADEGNDRVPSRRRR